MKRRRRVARVLRLVELTKVLVPALMPVVRSVVVAYRKAWHGPKPRRVVHVVITADVGPLRRQLMSAQEALERMAASHRALRRASVTVKPKPGGFLCDD